MNQGDRSPVQEHADARLREAEAHLWALLVWFGGRYENPYVDRDVAAAEAYYQRHLRDEDMTARHRDVMRPQTGHRETT